MLNKKTVRDVELQNMRALVRVDWNLPGDKDGKVTDDYRIRQSIPTIRYLQDRGCPVVIISHRGRPKGEVNQQYSLRPVVERAADILNQPIQFVDDCISDDAYTAALMTKPGGITVLENLRFHEEEKANDTEFAKRLSMMADIFVQDGFGVVHRAHASTEGITHWVASVSGLLLEKEVSTITTAVEHPKPPLVAVIGGAKITDKIEMIRMFLDKADAVVIGGAMANTFMKAQGKNIGKSIFEESAVGTAERLLSDFHSAELVVMSDDGVGVAGHMDKEEQRRNISPEQVGDSDYILDVIVGDRVSDLLLSAKTIIWSGTLGYAEFPQFAQGSNKVAKLMSLNKEATTLIGGGDTAAFATQWDKHRNSFTHISTGGGASLELMSGKTLPGIEALLDRS